MFPIALILGALWGGIWALTLQTTAIGQFLARRRTWITVVIGVAGDLLILLAIIPFDAWWQVCLIFASSAVAIVYRSQVNEFADQKEELVALQDQTRKQDHLES